MVHRPRQKQLGRGPLQLEVQAPPWQLGVLLVACEETSATGEILPDGHPVLQARSVQSLLRAIILTFASGELSD